MALDLFIVGPPARGLFLFGKRLPGKDDAAVQAARTDAKASAKCSLPSRGVSLNPCVEALQTMERMERSRQVLSSFRPEHGRKPLGAQVDLRA
jgi:hypothetical protein